MWDDAGLRGDRWGSISGDSVATELTSSTVAFCLLAEQRFAGPASSICWVCKNRLGRFLAGNVRLRIKNLHSDLFRPEFG